MRAAVDEGLDLVLVVILDRVGLPAAARRAERASLVEILRTLDHLQEIDVIRAAEIGRGPVAVVVDGIIDPWRAGLRPGAEGRLVHGAGAEPEGQRAHRDEPTPAACPATIRGGHVYCSSMKPAVPCRCGAPAPGVAAALPLVAVSLPSSTCSMSFENSSPSVGAVRSETLATGCTT